MPAAPAAIVSAIVPLVPVLATVETELKSKIQSLSGAATRPADRNALDTFYTNRAYRPVWVDSHGPTRAAAKVLAEFAQADSWGLNAAGYVVAANKAPMGSGTWTAEQTAAAEYEISALVLKYARDAQGGRIAEPDLMLSSYLDRHPVLSDPATVLSLVAGSAEPGAALQAFHPKHEQFQKLRELYLKLRAASPGTAKIDIPEAGPILAMGVTHADVAILRQRLGVTAATGNENVFDTALLQAVKGFQSEAALRSDGIVGPVTRKALNGSGAGDHLASIRANMEQWRWMPQDLGQTHLFVNVPAFSIDLVEDGVTTLEERVIVGKNTTETPIFSKQLTAIVLKPSWYLPDSIKLEKLLSAQRSGRPIEDEGYLVKKGTHVIDSGSVDWNSADLKDYAIYQPSGDGNALGAVKFLFPNKHSVYLHDTPNKSLFDASARLFSHGCVRLRNPLTLAQQLLDRDKGDGVWNVKDFVRKGDGNTQVELDKPLPIHVAYFTVWIDKDGTPQYLGDPYGHEERITQALEQKWDAIDKGVDHLAKVDTGQLKSVSVQAAPKKDRIAARTVRGGSNFDPPSGLTNANARTKPKFITFTSKSRGDGGVGELMRSALQH